MRLYFAQNKNLLMAIVLISSTGALFFPQLAVPYFWEWDEPWYAEAAKQMYLTGNWVVPVFNQELLTFKPPLLYWSQVFFYSLFGVSEFSARLPSAVSAVLCMGATFLLGRTLFSSISALWASLILTTSALFWVMARMAITDMMLTLFTMLTFFCFWEAYVLRNEKWILLSGLPIALGVLCKGPVAFALPAISFSVFLVSIKDYRWISIRCLFFTFFLVLCLSAPWFILVGKATHGVFIKEFFIRENLRRISEQLENAPTHPLYYFPGLLIGFAPWSSFFPLFTKLYRVPSQKHSHAVRFLSLWVATFFIFYSFVTTKWVQYLLPCYPALALLLSLVIENWRLGKIPLTRIWFAVLILLPLSWAILLEGAELTIAQSLWGSLWLQKSLLCISLSLFGLTIVALAKGLKNVAIVLFILTVFLNSFAVKAAWNDSLKKDNPIGSIVRTIQPEWRLPHEILACGYFHPKLVFYLDHPIKKIHFNELNHFFTGSQCTFLIVSERLLEEVSSRI